MAPTRPAFESRSVWSSSLRPPLDLRPAVLPEDDDGDDNRVVTELLNAALEGDLTRAKKLVKELSKAGKGVDEAVAAAAVCVTGTRRGPLHLAAANGKADMCKFLVKSCDVDVTDSDGATPLIFAIGLGSTTIVKILLSRGADLNKTDSNGVAPLHIAAERGSYEVAELLLSKEAEVDLICKNGGAPIHIATENGHANVLDILIEAGADVNAGSPATPLVIAAGKGLMDCIKCLLAAGADANIPNEDGRLPVQIAACQGWKECVEVLFPVTTPVAEYATWSIDVIIKHGTQLSVPDLDGEENDSDLDDEENVSDLDDKENVVSDDNTEDTQPHLSKSCSEQGNALVSVEEKGGGIETLMSGLNLGPEDPSDKASRPPLRRSTRARQANVRISGPEWAK